MGQNSVWFALWMLSALTSTSAENTTTYGFYPDRDNIKLFTLRIPISVVTPKDPDVSEQGKVPHKKPDSINVKIENDRGYICAEEKDSHNLEINGLPCDQCMNGKLLVTIETKKKDEILSKTRTILSDESKRAEICSLQPEIKKQGEDLIVTSPKAQPEDGCRWVFRDSGGSIGCCYSNRDYYTETGGCDPRMQSSACRKGSERPIIVEEENSCTLRINKLWPADSGNYLSNFEYVTPGFKKVILVEGHGEFSISGVILILCLALFFLLGVLTVMFCFAQRVLISSLIKETVMKIFSFEKATKDEPQDHLQILNPGRVA